MRKDAHAHLSFCTRAHALTLTRATPCTRTRTRARGRARPLERFRKHARASRMGSYTQKHAPGLPFLLPLPGPRIPCRGPYVGSS